MSGPLLESILRRVNDARVYGVDVVRIAVTSEDDRTLCSELGTTGESMDGGALYGIPVVRGDRTEVVTQTKRGERWIDEDGRVIVGRKVKWNPSDPDEIRSLALCLGQGEVPKNTHLRRVLECSYFSVCSVLGSFYELAREHLDGGGVRNRLGAGCELVPYFSRMTFTGPELVRDLHRATDVRAGQMCGVFVGGVEAWAREAGLGQFGGDGYPLDRLKDVARALWGSGRPNKLSSLAVVGSVKRSCVSAAGMAAREHGGVTQFVLELGMELARDCAGALFESSGGSDLYSHRGKIFPKGASTTAAATLAVDDAAHRVCFGILGAVDALIDHKVGANE